MAVPVPAGDHRVEVRFRPWPWTGPLVGLGIAAVAVGAWWTRRSRRERPEAETVPGASPRRARYGRRGLSAALAVVVVAGCGAPHELPEVGPAGVSTSSPLREVHLRRPESFATLDRVVAPEGRTVVVTAGADCEACADLLAPLAAAATDAGALRFSVLVLGLPAPSDEVGREAARLGLSRWDVVDPDPAKVARALGGATVDAITVLDAQGEVAGRWDADELDDSAVAAAVAEASR